MITTAVCPPETHLTFLVWLLQPPTTAILSYISLIPMDFPLVLIIAVILLCCIPSMTLWGRFKKDGVLSMNLRVQRCTQFMRAPFLVTSMKLLFVLIGYKYPTLCMFPKEMNGSSVSNIGCRTQHFIMQMLQPCMIPGV